MPTVSEITVRFMRRVQVKDYEPAEAEVSLRAHIDENEDSSKAGNDLILEAREMVKVGLSGKTKGPESSEVSEKTVSKAVKDETTKPKKINLKKNLVEGLKVLQLKK